MESLVSTLERDTWGRAAAVLGSSQSSDGLGPAKQQQGWQMYLGRKPENVRTMLAFFLDSCHKQDSKGRI